MKEESRLTLNFGNIEYNKYVLYKSKPLFSDEKMYVKAFNRKGESIAIKYIEDISVWERFVYAGVFLNNMKENSPLGESMYAYMKTEEFLSRLKFFKGSKADIFLPERMMTPNQNGVIFSLRPPKNLNYFISYCGNLWTLNYAEMIPQGNNGDPWRPKEYDTIVIKLNNIDNTDICKEITFDSSYFQRCFLTYWALYIWFQFTQVTKYNNSISRIGIFDVLKNPLQYYKWLENYKMVFVFD